MVRGAGGDGGTASRLSRGVGAGGKRQQGGSKKTVRRMGGKAKGQRLGPAEVTQEGDYWVSGGWLGRFTSHPLGVC